MERNNAVSVSQGRADQDEDKSQRERGFGGVLGHSAGIIGGTDSVGGLAEPYVFPDSESCKFGTGPWLSLIYSWRRYSNSSIIIFLSLFGLLVFQVLVLSFFRIHVALQSSLASRRISL